MRETMGEQQPNESRLPGVSGRWGAFAKIGLAMCCAAVLAACGSSSSPSSASQKGAAVSTVNIGFIGELTGTDEVYSVPMANAMKLAVGQVNAKGFVVKGHEYRLNLVIKDDQSDEARAEAVATEFVNQDHFKFVYGATSFLAGPIVNLTNAAQALFFTPSSVAGQDLGTPLGRYVFATLPATAAKANAFVQGTQTFLPNTKSMVVVGPETAITTTVLQSTVPLFKKAGISVTSSLYQAGSTSYAPILTSAARSGAKVLVLTDSPTANASFIEANNSLHAFPAVVGWGMGCTDGQQAGNPSLFVGAEGSGPSLVHPTTTAAKTFIATYTKAFGAPGSNITSAGWTYDYVGMLVKAMEAAGSVTNTNAITHALVGLKYSGINGNITYNASHAPVFPVVVCKYANGQFQYKGFGS